VFLHDCRVNSWPLPGAVHKKGGGKNYNQLDGYGKSDFRDKRMV
jgi:hypothetical protein